jgi:fructose-specific phosphotransferase system IIA component
MRLFSPELIKMHYYALDKKSCLTEMTEFLHEKGIVDDQKKFLDAILAREKIVSTGIGRGIAIPHARSASVKQLSIAVFVLDNELEFDSVDNNPVRIIFMIVVPESMKKEYMQILSLISNYLKNDDNIKKMLNCDNEEQLYELLEDLENEI